MKKNLLIFVVLFSLYSCKDKNADLSDFIWLQGKWTGVENEMQFYEVWNAADGNRMSGKGIGVANNDTVFSEEINLEQRGNDLFYTANVSESGSPVDFKFSGYKNDSAVFENPEHDFPQRIVYFHNGDLLYACIDGKQDGEYNKVEFSFRKTH